MLSHQLSARPAADTSRTALSRQQQSARVSGHRLLGGWQPWMDSRAVTSTHLITSWSWMAAGMVVWRTEQSTAVIVRRSWCT